MIINNSQSIGWKPKLLSSVSRTMRDTIDSIETLIPNNAVEDQEFLAPRKTKPGIKKSLIGVDKGFLLTMSGYSYICWVTSHEKKMYVRDDQHVRSARPKRGQD